MRAVSRSRGQSTLEYALAISVLALAVIAAAWPFSHDLQCGMQSYSEHFETFYSDPSSSGLYPQGGYDAADTNQVPDQGMVCQ